MTTGVFAWMLCRWPVGMWTGASLRLVLVVTQSYRRLALDKLQYGGAAC
jgi:hypothetical protein